MNTALFTNRAYIEEAKRQLDKGLEIDVSMFDGMEGELTQAHIDEGTQNNCRACPTALALNAMLAEHRDTIGHSLVSEVYHRFVYLSTDEPKRRCVLVCEISGLLAEWIRDYDGGGKLPPGKIYIEKDGSYKDGDGTTIQHWSLGIDVPDAYYNDPIGFEDNSVSWGV